MEALLESDIIRTFVAIADTGSFTRAAARVSRTPSAVSMQIKKLEERLGRQLFTREGRSIHLTADGEALLGYGRRLLELNDEALARFAAPPIEGSVKLGAPDDFGTRFLPDILSRFATSQPSIQVDVILDSSPNLLARLESGKLDLALVTGESRQPGNPGETLFTEPLVWLGARGGRAHRQDPLPLAVSVGSCSWRRLAVEALVQARRRFRVAYVCVHSSGQRAAVQADLAIAPLPLSLAAPPFQELGPQDDLPLIGTYELMLCRSNRRSAAANALADDVHASFATLREHSMTPAGSENEDSSVAC